MMSRLGCLVLLLATCLAGSGCVRRRLTLRTNPPGAQVFVDDQEIGVTPVSTPFTYYGTRKIQLVKDGYETLTVKQRFWPTWYEIPPLDFFSESLWPGELRDERAVDFEMIPQQDVPSQLLLNRAEALRQNSRQGQIVPLLTPPAGTP